MGSNTTARMVEKIGGIMMAKSIDGAFHYGYKKSPSVHTQLKS